MLIDSYKNENSYYRGVEVHNNKIYITGRPNLLILNNKDLGKFTHFYQSHIFLWLSISFTAFIGLVSIGFYRLDLISAKRRLDEIKFYEK